MSFVTDIARASSILAGAIAQAINSITDRVVLPISILPSAPVGEVLEPVGDAARAGADAVERIVDRLTGDGAGRVDEVAARTSRVLLASGQIVVSTRADAVATVRFTAQARNADWGRAGHESARVAVYVDGAYHSTVTVLAERTGEYAVNLAGVAPGTRTVELRDASDTTRAGVGAVVTVGPLRAVEITGDAALVQRHAPIVQLRDQDRGQAHSTSHSDSPLLLVPAVTRHADGSRTIAYRIAFSNEESGTPVPKLLATYGRTGDLEPIYRVRVAADGKVLESSYQAALHQWKSFDGQRAGDRPVIRVATANNNFSARVRAAGDGAERWSEVAIDDVGAATSDFDVMRAHPWTWAVMAKEVLREGKVAATGAARGAHQIGDPRRYLYVGPVSDAVRGAIELVGGIMVELRDGRRVLAKLARGFAGGRYAEGALELPDGVTGDAVRGVSLLGVRAAVLGADLAIRDLPQAA